MPDTRSSILATTLAATLILFASSAAATPLDWLSGSWCAETNGSKIEEHWLSPSANRLLAVNRTVVDGSTKAFEFLHIDLSPAKPVYLAQPGGRTATEFVQAKAGPQWVRFENLLHDFPQFIEYRREGDTLVATIGGPAPEGSQQFATQFEVCENE